ncbi:glutathione S-transferase [Boletus edulis BED1]|uniref:glutathione transferase n=1 Tax=Boletus edulis BED1 TaxID=1328754 RepID=A0AAD4BMD1_BOLED|nr:glutathione S-transferase [Boletus edulis BED1]
MVLKIHGHPVAPLVRLVAEVCKEKEIPYEVVNVAVYKGEHKTPAFKQFQPFGQVPYIEDDDFILYEARAICRYLVKQYESQGTLWLVPKDPRSEALFEQAASVEYSNFYPFALGLATEKIIKKHRGLPADEARVNEYLENLNAKLDVYDDILGKQSYLAGQSVTLADLFHLPYAAIVIEELGYPVLENRPNVARWWKAISTRPAWQAVKVSA